ncbi:hypothetical protein JCM37172_16710 [Faecalimonas hominis]
MEKKQTSRKTKRTAIIATLLACVLLIGGTVAWLTTHDSLSNQFTVGNINPIDPTEPDGGPDDKPIDKDESKLNGNLYEPDWVANSKIFPGETVVKNPYVGVGAGSEKCYVYVYVNNTMKNDNKVYFTINDGWEAVEATTTGTDGEYVGGIFKYTAGLDGSQATKNVWTTTPLFSDVVAKDTATGDDFMTADGTKAGAIEVHSFQHQMFDGEGQVIDEANVVIPAAKAAFGIK